MKVYAVNHIQLAIPPNSEDLARAFYGEILGLKEKPKPEHLVNRGGVWFEQDNLKLHFRSRFGLSPCQESSSWAVS